MSRHRPAVARQRPISPESETFLFRRLGRSCPCNQEKTPPISTSSGIDRPAETETKFRSLLPEAVERNDPSYHGQLLTQIARTEGLQRKFVEAHRTLDQAEELLPRADSRTHVRYLLERGRVFNSSGRPSESRPLFLKAWEPAKDANEDFYAVDAAHMMAIIEAPDYQLEWNYMALELAERSKDPRTTRWKASLYNNIGWTLFDSKQYSDSLTFSKRP